MKTLEFDKLDEYRKAYEKDDNARNLTGAMAKTEFKDLAYLPMNAAKLNGDFAVEVKTNGICAQQKSGRCWMFAALNILREIVASKCNLKEFELSQNYLTFYDKLEKANNFLETIIANADHPLYDDILMNTVLKNGIGDGGYWDQAVDLIEKYGICPKSVNPETYQSEHTDTFMTLLNHLLKKDAAELKKLIAEGQDPEPRKDEMMAEIFKAECIVFGEPVKTFDFEYRDKDGMYHSDKNITPKQFYDKYAGLALEDYVTVTSEPASNKEMHRPYTFHSACNMVDQDVFALNLPQKELEDLCIKQLKGNEPVWFGCDAGAFGSRKEGIWDPDSVNYEGLLGGVSLFMDKQDRLDYKNSYSSHAMILVGVNFDENDKPNRWKIENSWGKEVGKDGYFVASEKYFREYVYEAVINEKYLNDEQKSDLEKEPIQVNAWDAE